MKILESSQTLLHVLKRETVNLTKCGHRDGSVGARQYLDVRLEVSKRSVGGSFAPIYPGLQVGYKPCPSHLLTSWNIQVVVSKNHH